MKEETKRALVRTTAWTAWMGAITMAALRATETVGLNWGIVAVVFIGIAIVAGSTTSRYRMQDTIVGAMKAGYELSRRDVRKGGWHEDATGRTGGWTAEVDERDEVDH